MGEKSVVPEGNQNNGVRSANMCTSGDSQEANPPQEISQPETFDNVTQSQHSDESGQDLCLDPDEKVDVSYFDVQAVDPATRITLLFSRIAAGAVLVYFGIHELIDEIRDYRKVRRP